ncbi:sigma-70 family RNA polymerase sigma factor [bacterium]|nr:sigma-70 family RNA polymerase sigma factor [bacterium]
MEENSRHLRLISAGEDQSKFEDLLVRNFHSLYSFALRLTGSKDEAEELVQETSVKGYVAYPNLREKSKVKQWLLKILLNSYRNRVKKRKRQDNILDVELTEDLISSASVGAYDQGKVFGQLPDKEIEEALGKLPSAFRLVILLADVEGLSYQEIAEMLHCSAGTVASRLFRARQLLREYLEDYAKRWGLL